MTGVQTCALPICWHDWRTDTSQTFDFLGFTHYAGASLGGAYMVQRKTSRTRLRRRLQAVREWCRSHCHDPVIAQWQMLSRKLKGHYGYYGIRGNARALHSFHRQVWFIWLRALRRRSQTAKVSRLVLLLNGRFPLPSPRITHPDNWLPGSPGDLLRRAGCGNTARPVL